ncbi:MAG: ABC transporter permease [candidate division Zixibacteria bacterium]|nr:ABC transporter permease [candidate division Zixibacteria bacterium]NIR66115.1 ABC transporter permease [candidate division Zixibacteria bacterium]NIS17433.1 ABC transporter permease [candidate division Zixibacteria bacterium]NIS47736.1 ABC transporter permease [candidate division Zixibacteria bacterium]NIT53761.1 ABC transporter permease [candidate division Zixibacteria bacterium]
MFIKLAWRNIFRNIRRTAIASTVVAIGLASLIFVDALMIGMEKDMIKSATESFMGEGQIHREGFQETYAVDKTIVNLDSLTERLANDELVKNLSVRVLSYAAISSPVNMSSVTMVGIDPETEKNLSQIDDAIEEGSYFKADGGERNIVIGSELAERLEVGIGDRVVLTATQAETENLAQELFRVSGIYFMNVDELDKGMAFVRIGKAREMLNIGDGGHEIAIDFIKSSVGRNKDHPFWQKYSQHANVAEGWAELMPQLETAFELSRFSIYITGLILFGVVALGIINALFMSLYERMYEFGVLLAVGTRKNELARLIVFEAGALAIVSAIAGIILGFVVNYIFGHIGFDFTGSEYSGVTFREPLYPVMTIGQYIIYPILVFVFTLIVSLYPAIYAARLTPVKAMRKAH